MKDWSLHLLDILENSAKAGATRVDVTLTAAGTWLALEVNDNGPGLPPEIKVDPTDPFRTTRRDRPVGLGLSLIRRAAEQAGGSLEISEGRHGGVRLTATMNLGHVDAKPLGDVPAALTAAMLAWPELELLVRLGPEPREVLNTAEIRKELDGVSVANPAVQKFVREQLQTELTALTEWAAKAMLGSTRTAQNKQ